MLDAIIRSAINQRWLVMFVVIGAAGLGVYNYQRLPIDAVPDITNVQVQINTEAPGYAPLEAEQRITFLVELAMAGLPARSNRGPSGDAGWRAVGWRGAGAEWHGDARLCRSARYLVRRWNRLLLAANAGWSAAATLEPGR